MKFDEMVKEMAMEKIEALEDEKDELASKWRDLNDEVVTLKAGLKNLGKSKGEQYLDLELDDFI